MPGLTRTDVLIVGAGPVGLTLAINPRRSGMVYAIAYDGAEQPAYTMSGYTPSTVPGCRTPHLWLGNGGSLYDAMGPEFTLLRFAAVDVAALEAAVRHRGVPLKVLDVDRPQSGVSCHHRLVLSRPDQHVATRADALPPDPLALIDRVRGAASETSRTAARSGEVDAGRREENGSNQKTGARL